MSPNNHQPASPESFAPFFEPGPAYYPVSVSDDMSMMHDDFAVHDAVEKLSKERLIDFLKFRFGCLLEEVNEGLDAIEAKNPEEIVDSLIDLTVFAVGTIDLLKVDFDVAWGEVLRANLSKEVGVKPERENPFGLPDLIKPPGFVPPSHEGNHGILTEIFS